MRLSFPGKPVSGVPAEEARFFPRESSRKQGSPGRDDFDKRDSYIRPWKLSRDFSEISLDFAMLAKRQ